MSLPVRVSDNDTLNSENLMAVKDENGDWVPETDPETGEPMGSHRYGYTIPGLCADFYEKTNNQGELKEICVTVDGRLLDGDTGASRPNLMLQPYQKPDGTYSAWAVLGYEETKGLAPGLLRQTPKLTLKPAVKPQMKGHRQRDRIVTILTGAKMLFTIALILANPIW